MYTDGSKCDAGVGCAVIYKGTSYTSKLPDSTSIHTAELTAIIKALKIVCNSSYKKFVIFSDSTSAVLSLNKFNSHHPLIQVAQEWLFRIRCKFKSVRFCWVPSHVGIKGNEMADKEAKNAVFNSSEIISKVPHIDMKQTIRSYIFKKWQERWASPTLANNKKYKTIRQKVNIWQSSFNSERRIEIVLTRLRIGHTFLTHKFILDRGDPPICQVCKVQLSVEHILVQCRKYTNVRHKYHMQNKDISTILNDEVDVGHLIGFLKEIKVFNLI